MAARHQFEERADGGTEYTWTIAFHEVSIVARPLIAVAARLFRQATLAQARKLTAYLDGRPAHETPPAV